MGSGVPQRQTSMPVTATKPLPRSLLVDFDEKPSSDLFTGTVLCVAFSSLKQEYFQEVRKNQPRRGGAGHPEPPVFRAQCPAFNQNY